MHSAWKINPALLAIGAVAIIGFSGLAYYSQYLPAASPARTRLEQGQLYLVKYKTSSAVPAVKVELCNGANSKTCKVLITKATGVQVLVVIPTNFPVGNAIIKISERNRALTLNGKIQKTIPVTITASSHLGSLTSAPSSGSGSTGLSSGTSSGGGSTTVSQTPKPTPTPFIQKAVVQVACVYYPNTFNSNVMMVSVDAVGSYRDMMLKYRKVGEGEWHPADQHLQPVYSQLGGPANPYSPSQLMSKIIGNYILYFNNKLDYNQSFEVQLQDFYNRSIPYVGLPSKIYTFTTGAKGAHSSPYCQVTGD